MNPGLDVTEQAYIYTSVRLLSFIQTTQNYICFLQPLLIKTKLQLVPREPAVKGYIQPVTTYGIVWYRWAAWDVKKNFQGLFLSYAWWAVHEIKLTCLTR